MAAEQEASKETAGVGDKGRASNVLRERVGI